MKTKLILLCCLFAMNSFAQDQERIPLKKKARKTPALYETVNHVAKINLTSFMFRTFALQYEKKITRSKTFALGLIYRPNVSTPFYNIILKDTNFAFSKETRYMMSSSKYTTFMLTPEFRFYLRKKAPRGLYLAPFLRYKFEKENANYLYQESSISSVLRVGKYNIVNHTIGAGVLFGIQILTKKKVTIDFWFFGPWAGGSFSKRYSNINTSNINIYDKASVEATIEGYDTKIDSKHSLQWDSKGFSNRQNNFSWGLRMFGINIGYAF